MKMKIRFCVKQIAAGLPAPTPLQILRARGVPRVQRLEGRRPEGVRSLPEPRQRGSGFIGITCTVRSIREFLC